MEDHWVIEIRNMGNNGCVKVHIIMLLPPQLIKNFARI